jgi:hypothetical protein
MTEADWLTAANPAFLLRHVHARPWRKRCLFTCAVWANVRDLLVSKDSRAALELMDGVAEAELPYDSFESVDDIFLSVGADETERSWRAPSSTEYSRLRLQAAELAAGAAGDYDEGAEEWHHVEGQMEMWGYDAPGNWYGLGLSLCSLARCVFGNPFRPAPVVVPAWLKWHDGTVRKLAEAACAEHTLPEGTLEPARLTVLADALEDAGCNEAELSAHLRSPGPHVRGCWVVDLLLARY